MCAARAAVVPSGALTESGEGGAGSPVTPPAAGAGVAPFEGGTRPWVLSAGCGTQGTDPPVDGALATEGRSPREAPVTRIATRIAAVPRGREELTDVTSVFAVHTPWGGREGVHRWLESGARLPRPEITRPREPGVE
jgi:hypothetical protein